MRVLVIDPDPARAALVAEGLVGVYPLEVRQAATFDEAEAVRFSPDVVVIEERLKFLLSKIFGIRKRHTCSENKLKY